MAIVAKPSTFSAGATIIASEHNNNFDTIYNAFNGNIDNNNIANSAGIADSKLAQITSPNKVAGSALTTLASVPSSAGIISPLNLASGTTGTNAFLNGNSTWVGGNTAGGLAVLDAIGLMPQGILATGTTGATTFLRGDQTWAAVNTSSGIAGALCVSRQAYGTTGTNCALDGVADTFQFYKTSGINTVAMTFDLARVGGSGSVGLGIVFAAGVSGASAGTYTARTWSTSITANVSSLANDTYYTATVVGKNFSVATSATYWGTIVNVSS